MFPTRHCSDNMQLVDNEYVVNLSTHVRSLLLAVNMLATWRDGTTAGEKLVASLQHRLPPSHLSPAHMQDFCTRVQDM